MMDFLCMHGESRFLPLLIVETPSMTATAVMAFLGSSPKVHLFITAQLTHPQVNNVPGFAVQAIGNTNVSTINNKFTFL